MFNSVKIVRLKIVLMYLCGLGNTVLTARHIQHG